MEILKGRRYEIPVVINQASGVKDLSGYAAEMIIGNSNKTPIVKLSGIITAPESGCILFTILPTSLSNVSVGHYNIEVNIWEILDKSKVYTPITGTVDINDGLNKNPAN